MPRDVRRPRSGLGIGMVIATWLLAAAYLGGPAALLPFVLMTSGVLLPAAALLADRLRGTSLSDDMRACAGGAVALLLAIAAYHVRRALPVPPALFDGAVIVATLGAALATGALRRYVTLALSPTFRAAGWLLGGVVPAAACLVWMGFEVPRDGVVRFYGLLTIDFSNLAGMVALIKASPGAPNFVTAGSGPLHYHWWFFSLPAWMSEFVGAGARASSALALSNLVAAVLLAATLCAVVADHLRARVEAGLAVSEKQRHRLPAWSASIVIVAPLTTYAYQFLVGVLHRSWFTVGSRNSLFLSILNSMSTFGNNTLALSLVLIIGAVLAALRQRPSWILAGLAGLASFGILGLSVTLTMPLALAGGAWVLMGRVRQPWRLVVIAALIGAAGFPLVRASNLMGDSSQHLVLSFDRGQFIQNVALGMAPIWILSATSLVSGRLSFATLLVWACVLVPTFVDFAGHGAVSSTMSMKMASLLAVASVPSIADGLVRLLAPRRLAAPAANVDVIAPGAPASTSGSSKIWRAAAGLALIAGLANSLVYTLQFAVYRLTDHAGPRTVDLSADYVGALDFVRRNSPRDAVVVDPDGDRLLDTIGTVLIAERLVWLPTRYSAVLVRSDRDYPAIMARPAIWRAWESSQFTDEALAAQIAGQADVLVAPPNIESAHWQRRKVAGTFAVYSSRDRPSP